MAPTRNLSPIIYSSSTGEVWSPHWVKVQKQGLAYKQELAPKRVLAPGGWDPDLGVRLDLPCLRRMMLDWGVWDYSHALL